PVLHDLDLYGGHDWDEMSAHRLLTIKSLLGFGQAPLWMPYACGGFSGGGNVPARATWGRRSCRFTCCSSYATRGVSSCLALCCFRRLGLGFSRGNSRAVSRRVPLRVWFS